MKKIKKVNVKKSAGAALAFATLLIGGFGLGQSFTQTNSAGNEIPVGVAEGGTGGADAASARTNLDVYSGAEALLAQYPVGSIYMSITNTNPGTLFGGTWATWGAGRVPVSVNGSDTPINGSDKTGGSTNPLTSHNHSDIRYSTSTNGWPDDPNANGNGSANQGFWRGGISTRNTSSTGDNTNHNNWQPFITTYMWKRTA